MEMKQKKNQEKEELRHEFHTTSTLEVVECDKSRIFAEFHWVKEGRKENSESTDISLECGFMINMSSLC